MQNAGERPSVVHNSWFLRMIRQWCSAMPPAATIALQCVQSQGCVGFMEARFVVA